MATLLLADDSVTIQRVIELTFANESIRVVTAPDGHAATAMLEAERPDIVLADVGLPAVDGYTLAERLKRNPATAAIPVLLLTGAFEPIDEARARRTGCNGVLVKPFEPHRVVTLVKTLLAGQTPDNLWPNDMPRIDGGGSAPETAPRPHAALRDSVAEPGMMPSPSAIEEVFEIGLDDLDLAFSRLDPIAPPSRIDADSVSDFQRDIQELRSVTPEPLWAPAAPPPRPVAPDVAAHLPVEELTPIDVGDFDWDLPAAPATRIDAVPVPAAFPEAPPPSASAPPEPLTSPTPPAPPAPPAPPVNVPVLSTPWTPPAPPDPLPTAPAPPTPPTPPTPPAPPSPPTPVFAPWVPPQVIPAAPVEMPAPPPAPPIEAPAAPPAPEPVPAFAPWVPPQEVAAAPTPPAPPTPPTPPAPEPAPQFTAPTLAAAFSALLAAEQSQPAPTKPATADLSSSEAMVEAVVRRVASRLTGEVDRLVREELERLKR